MSVRKTFLMGAALLAGIVATPPASAQDSRVMTTAVDFTTEELDNLLAPIALYPDAILAQILVAATFPDQIEFAARHVRARGTRDIDNQPWDLSVKAVAYYPPVLNMLADRLDWTTALGQAYAMQSGDVMESVQHLREMANAQGNLRSTSQQNVVVDGRYIRIEPAQPRVIYVPTYDPEVIYYRPIVHVGVYTGHWSFGIGFPIGSWLSYDCDWYGRRVYYSGWNVNFGWRYVAYPYIHISPVYVHPRYHVVYVNRTVIHRTVNYDRLRGYNTIHRTVTYDRRRSGAPGPIRHDLNDRRGDDNRGGRDPRNDPRNDGRNDPRNDGRNDPRNDGRNDPRNDGRNDPRDDSRNVGPRIATRDDDRVRQPATPPAPQDKRTQGRDENTGSDRRGGVFAPRQAEPAPRPSMPRTTESRPSAPRTTESRPSAPRTTESRPSAPRTTESRPSAPRTTESRPSAPRTTESRPSFPSPRMSSPPPSRASSPPPSRSSSSARQSPPSSGKRESAGRPAGGSTARGKR